MALVAVRRQTLRGCMVRATRPRPSSSAPGPSRRMSMSPSVRAKPSISLHASRPLPKQISAAARLVLNLHQRNPDAPGATLALFKKLTSSGGIRYGHEESADRRCFAPKENGRVRVRAVGVRGKAERPRPGSLAPGRGRDDRFRGYGHDAKCTEAVRGTKRSAEEGSVTRALELEALASVLEIDFPDRCC